MNPKIVETYIKRKRNHKVTFSGQPENLDWWTRKCFRQCKNQYYLLYETDSGQPENLLTQPENIHGHVEKSIRCCATSIRICPKAVSPSPKTFKETHEQMKQGQRSNTYYITNAYSKNGINFSPCGVYQCGKKKTAHVRYPHIGNHFT